MPPKAIQIEQFLLSHKQPIYSSVTKWDPIGWENNRRDVHIAYVKLIRQLELDKPKQLSLLLQQHRVQVYLDNHAPEVCIKPLIDNLHRLERGKGTQLYAESIYKVSLRLAGKFE